MGKQHLLTFVGSDFGPAKLDNPHYVNCVIVIKELLTLTEGVSVIGDNTFAKLAKHLAKQANLTIIDGLNGLLVIQDSTGELKKEYQNSTYLFFDPSQFNETNLNYWIGELKKQLPILL